MGKKYLLDSNIIIYLEKGITDKKVVDFKFIDDLVVINPFE